MASFFERVRNLLTRDDEEKRKRQPSFIERVKQQVSKVTETVPVKAVEATKKTTSSFFNRVNKLLEKPSPIPMIGKPKGEKQLTIGEAILPFSKFRRKKATEELEKATEFLPPSPKRFVRGTAGKLTFLEPKQPETKKWKVAGVEFHPEDVASELASFLAVWGKARGVVKGVQIAGKAEKAFTITPKAAKALTKSPELAKFLSKYSTKAAPVIKGAIEEGLTGAITSGYTTQGDLKKRLKSALESGATFAPFGAGAKVGGKVLTKAGGKAAKTFLGKLAQTRIAPEAGKTLLARGGVMMGTAVALESVKQMVEQGKIKPVEIITAGATTLPFAGMAGMKTIKGKVKLTGKDLEKATEAFTKDLESRNIALQQALESGSESAIKAARNQITNVVKEAKKFGVSLKPRAEAELRKEVETAGKIAEAEIAPKTVTEGLTERYGSEAVSVRKHQQVLRLSAEKRSKTGELFREHIPATKNYPSSDEVAAALGKSEGDYLAEILPEGVAAAPQKQALSFYRTLKRQAEKKVKTLPFLRKTPAAIAEGQEAIPGVKPSQAKAVEGQLKDISVLAKRAGVTMEQRKVLIKNLFNKESFAKINRQEAEIVKNYLQPQAKARLEPLLKEAKESIFGKRFGKAAGFAIAESKSPLEKEVKATSGIKDISEDVVNLIEDVKSLPSVGRKKSPILSFLAKVPMEQTGARFAGVKKEYHESARGVLSISTNLENKLKNAITETTEKLSKSEKERVLFKASGVDVAELNQKELQAAEYLREVFDAHLNLANKVRALVGKPPIPRRKNYIPFIISEDLGEAVGRGRTAKFFLERTKTNQELLAGLFSKDPKHIAEVFSRSAGRFFKRDFYQAALKDRAEQVRGMSEAGAAFVREVEQKDIGILPDLSSNFVDISVERANEIISKFFGKKIPISPELKKALENTQFAGELKDVLKQGYFKLPRFKIQQLSNIPIPLIYLGRLGLNTLFTAVNLTQPFLGLPFVRSKDFIGATAKTMRYLVPLLRTAKDTRFMKALSEAEVFGGIYGEDIKIMDILRKTIGSNITGSEFLNKTQSAYGALGFVESTAKKTGTSLKEREAFKFAAEFTKYINPVAEKGKTPFLARKGLLGKIGYMFQVFPLEAADVYYEAFKAGMKDKGVAEFWQSVGRQAGASPEAIKMFEKLPPESKAKALKIIVAAAAPVLAIYSLTGSWTAAQRMLPWQSAVPDFRNPLVDLTVALSDFMDDPEANKDDFRRQVLKTFEWAQLKRFKDALELAQTGRIEDYKGRTQYVLPEGVSPVKVGLFGRQVISESGKFETIKKAERESQELSDERTRKAREILNELNALPTEEAKDALWDSYVSQGVIDEKLRDRVGDLVEEDKAGVGSIERRLKGLDVQTRARLIKDDIDKLGSEEEKDALWKKYVEQGIITEAVVEAYAELIKTEKTKSKEPTLFERFRNLPGVP